MTIESRIRTIHSDIIACNACPRLRTHCMEIARIRRKAYLEETYWARPVPGFGDPGARLVIIGLAPAAHGANRTGRIFTGDRSGDWLYRALHKAGFANQPQALHAKDGLTLTGAYVTCAARCAPPGNALEPSELSNCRDFLKRELVALSCARVHLVLGGVALNAAWRLLNPDGARRPKFAHGAKVALPEGRTLLMSYHPSQQNTFTGRLTEPMFDSVFREARKLVGTGTPAAGRKLPARSARKP